VCDGTKPELINDICPNVHILFNDGSEGVGYFGILDNKWRAFTKSFKQAALADYTYGSGATISDIPVIGWKPVEKLSAAKKWDRVWSKEFGWGTVVHISDDILKYTVLFDAKRSILHNASNRIDNMPDERCWYCTLEDGHPNATIYLSEQKPEVPGSKRDIGDRVKSKRYGQGTIVKLDGNDSFLVAYDIAQNGLWGDDEMEGRYRWEEESTL
jgi:hypothetical protein